MGTRKNRLTEVFLTCTHELCLSKTEKNITIFHLKIIVFTAMKNAVYYIGMFVQCRIWSFEVHDTDYPTGEVLLLNFYFGHYNLSSDLL